MENYSIVIFILFIMIGLSALADRIRLPYPVLLITAGIAIGFIPDLPHIELNPEIIFLIFLPPLLYDAAFNIDAKEFRVHFNTISTLAISLVFLSAAAIAVAAYYLIPGMTWPLAFVLGAILSATDAVAAINVTKGLGLSHKTSTILEGESLVNDASALVAYQFAVAAVTGTAFVIWKASIDFLVLMAGGLLVGFVAAKTLAFIIKRIENNGLATISFMLLMPFVAYRVAEELNVSGVIAVVMLGLAISRYSHHVLSESVKKQSKAFWDIIIFLLNGLIFILIGLQFPYVVESMDKSHLLPYIGYAFVITAVAILVRLVRVLLQRINLQKGFQRRRGRISEHALLDLRSSLIISWSGMRGIVSLATAMALPATLENGAPFPLRSATIFIATCVVLITIVGQGTTLPWLVKRLKHHENQETKEEMVEAPAD